MAKHKKRSKKKIAIIIPFYGQTVQDLAIPLGSINNQIDVDFSQIEIQLINDGGIPVKSDELKIFANLDIKSHDLPENVGAGMARQYGIEQTSATYVTFVDSDDMLASPFSLRDFFGILKQSGNHQIITSKFWEQKKTVKSQDSQWILHENTEQNFMVAKWFNRQFLQKYDIKFQPELPIFEDTYFLYSAFLVANDVIYANNPSYIWLSNENSLTRENGGKNLHQLDIWTRKERLYLRFIQKNFPENFKAAVEARVIDIFFRNQESPALDEAAMKHEIHILIDEFSDYWSGNLTELHQIAENRLQKYPRFKNNNMTGFDEFMSEFTK